VNGVSITQVRPWFIDLTLNVSFSVNSETSSWNISNFIVNTELSNQNFSDPYYTVNTNGAYVSRINRTHVAFDEWDIEKVKDHIRSGTYTYYANAPSFLMRFTDDLSVSTCCGIESLVNPNKLSGLGINPDEDVSYADYLFWSTTAGCEDLNLYTVNDISTEFPNIKFDFDHLFLYNLTKDSQQICP
jgi:hypothetical protein